MSFELYLIRHGQSANNALPEPQRVEDPGLTSLGASQAEALANRFAAGSVTDLLTSGFLRALQTTRPLARRLGLRPRIWTDLHEVGGCYAGYVAGQEVGRPGMNCDTLSQQFPEFQLPEDIDATGWWKSQPYESWERARTRATHQIQRLVAEFNGTEAKVACVIHADFKMLLIEAMQQGEDFEVEPTELRNTGVTRLQYGNGQFRMLVYNNVDHLTDM